MTHETKTGETRARFGAHRLSRVARTQARQVRRGRLRNSREKRIFLAVVRMPAFTPHLGRASSKAAAGDVDGAVDDLKRLASSGSPFVPKDLALKTAAALVPMTTIAGRLYALPATGPRILVVFLRGAYDAANIVVPTSAIFTMRPARPWLSPGMWLCRWTATGACIRR